MAEGIKNNSIGQHKAMMYGFKKANQWYEQRPTKLQWLVLEMSKRYADNVETSNTLKNTTRNSSI